MYKVTALFKMKTWYSVSSKQGAMGGGDVVGVDVIRSPAFQAPRLALRLKYLVQFAPYSVSLRLEIL